MLLLRPIALVLLVSLASSALAEDKNADCRFIERTFHLNRPPLALESKLYSSFSPAAGVVADRVSYATAYNLRIPAIVYHPPQKGSRRPALVIVNGHGGDKSSWYAYWAGIVYARAGGVVLTYDPIGEFERNSLRASGTSQHDALIQPDDMARRMAGVMIEDVLQGVRYLAQRKDVDRRRIAVLGYSMGSFISSLACSVEPLVHACVLVGGGDLDGPNGYWDSSGRKMCQSIPYRSLMPLGDRGAAIFALHARRGPTLIYNGAADQVVDIPHHGADFFADLQNRTISRLGSHPKTLFQYDFLAAGGHRPYFVTRPVALWLHEHLTFPEWTADSIAHLPQTPVSEWAATHNLTAPGFRNQVGEGGTLAVGDNIPAIDRDLLHALPEAVWTEHRDRYVYESWVTAAGAAIRSAAP